MNASWNYVSVIVHRGVQPIIYESLEVLPIRVWCGHLTLLWPLLHQLACETIRQSWLLSHTNPAPGLVFPTGVNPFLGWSTSY